MHCREVAASLEHFNEDGVSYTCVKLQGLALQSLLGRRQLEVSVHSPKLQSPLKATADCMVTVGLPAAINADFRADAIINGATCGSLQPSFAFIDAQSDKVVTPECSHAQQC